jgi:hypothetical protein
LSLAGWTLLPAGDEALLPVASGARLLPREQQAGLLDAGGGVLLLGVDGTLLLLGRVRRALGAGNCT